MKVCLGEKILLCLAIKSDTICSGAPVVCKVHQNTFDSDSIAPGRWSRVNIMQWAQYPQGPHTKSSPKLYSSDNSRNWYEWQSRVRRHNHPSYDTPSPPSYSCQFITLGTLYNDMGIDWMEINWSRLPRGEYPCCARLQTDLLFPHWSVVCGKICDRKRNLGVDHTWRRSSGSCRNLCMKRARLRFQFFEWLR